MTKIAGTLCDDVCTFMIVSHQNLLRMRNVSNKSCKESQNTCFMFIIPFLTAVPSMR